MKFNGDPIVGMGEDWIDVDQPDGVSRLFGYNEDLLEIDAGETAPAVARSNETTIRDRALAALAANRTDIAEVDKFLAIASPTTAQNAAAIKELARQSKRQAQQLNGIIRLLLNRFDGTD